MAGGGGVGGGRNVGSIQQSGFLEALDKSQSKRDGGFKNSWSYDHSEESEGDTEKDEANLLIFDESDETCSPNGEIKPCRHRLGFVARNDALRTYSRRNKSDTLGNLKSITTGLNVSGSSKKICVNAENISCSDSEGQVRHFCPHTQTRVKTAAQKKEYPHNIPKVDNNCNKWSQLQEMMFVNFLKVVSDSKMQIQNATQFQFFEDDESVEPHTVFIGPIEKLIVYPPPPAKGGISVTNEDLHCLNEGEFLNDVIIDFYLKYLVLERLKKEDADRIHVFSSFFYKRLNQRERRNLQETSKLTIQQKRHGRVKTWTRHVDIFEKDFIFVPLNEAAHWFLAVICFPGLEKPIYEANPYYQENVSTQIKSSSLNQDRSASSPVCAEMDPLQQSPLTRKLFCKKHFAELTDTNTDSEENEPLYCKRNSFEKSGFKKLNHLNSTVEEFRTMEPICPKHDLKTSEANGMQNEHKIHIQASDGLQKIRLNYSEKSADSNKLNEDELIDFSEDQDNQENSSDDDGLADDNCNSELGQWHLKPTICKQPCILLMDSLRGPSRSNVVRTLREYLEVEWEVRKGSRRSFSKDVMKGSNPKVPQQNNFSDCGVYVLQYVESFFETPILSFELPMNLTDWFPRPRMKTKREEIKNIILNLQEQQNKEKKGQKDSNLTEKYFQERTEQFISN
ncbi:sentrin-specific protease 6 [Notechis scutatus]|uniref:Sentrin-specific protease 6 n=1 Tax=Notechis scutatus TaxID=8663 RepID=A0A6J1TRC6_9SAUR|nr:sentrin-specific protease 6 [Notechis scutatus]